jgi:hypothetical protein
LCIPTTSVPTSPAPPPQAQDAPAARLSPALSWRLRRYLDALLAQGYSPLMEVVRRELEPGLGTSRLEAPDFRNFLSLLCTATAYARTLQVGGGPRMLVLAPARALRRCSGWGRR